MMRINIKELEIFANHGVLSEENILGQKFCVSVSMDIHTFVGDDISKTVNYANVCAFIEEYMQKNTFKLIETAAAGLSLELVKAFSGIENITVEIKKPWAPIKMNLSYTNVEILRTWHKVYLSIGSNLGDTRYHLLKAVEALRADQLIRNIKKSEFIVTKPYGYTNQNDFLNGCVELETVYEPMELLNALHEIENADDRTREIHWGPRTIDLDIIYYDNLIMKTEEPIIPHPEMQKREFVLRPLKELAPNLLHPVFNKTTVQMLEGLTG